MGNFCEEPFAFHAQLFFFVTFYFGCKYFMLQLHFVFQTFCSQSDSFEDE